jgi:hypothetical protein
MTKKVRTKKLKVAKTPHDRIEEMLNAYTDAREGCPIAASGGYRQEDGHPIVLVEIGRQNFGLLPEEARRAANIAEEFARRGKWTAYWRQLVESLRAKADQAEECVRGNAGGL